MENKRPKGVILFGILTIAIGIIIFMIIFPEFYVSYHKYQNISLVQYKRNLTILTLYSLMLGISGIGVLMLKNWARKLCMILSIIILLFPLFFLLTPKVME